MERSKIKSVIVVYFILLLSFSAIFTTNIFVDTVEATWWDLDWDHYRTITIDSSVIDTDLVDFPILVSIPDGIGDACDGGDSLRFTAGSNSGGTDNETEYDFEIERWVDGSDRLVWVEVQKIYSGSDSVFNMYYGNSGASDGQDVTGTWNSNYEAVYHMTETGATIYDSTTNSNDGTKSGTVNQAPGFVGYGLDFLGSDDYYTIGNLDVDTTDEFTLLAFVEPDDLSSPYDIVISATDSTDDEFIWALNDASGDEDDNGFYSYGAGSWYYGGFDLDDDNWYMVAVAIDGTDLDLYLDDVRDNQAMGDTLDNPNEDWHIGVRVDNKANDFDGVIDEIRISHIQRNESWITTTFHSCNLTSGFLTIGDEQNAPAGASVPAVTTNDATGVEETNATIRGTLTNNGSADTTCWFLYGDETPPTDNNETQGVKDHGASFSYNWQSLTPGVLYYFDTKANNSEGWDQTGSEKNFLTKPNTPTGATCTGGEGWINVSWSSTTGADKYHVRYKTGSSPTSITDGTLFDNVTALYINKSIGAGTHYFSVWSYAYESSPALHQYSDTYDTTSGTESAPPTWYSNTFGGEATTTEPPAITWYSDTFGGEATVEAGTIDVYTDPATWTGGLINCGSNIQNNFTFYQDGTATIQIKIGFNATNYTFVNYTTWSSNGADQYCANFTINAWSSESMIEPKVGENPVTILKDSLSGDSNFLFGVRIWAPKGLTSTAELEDFEIMLVATDLS